MMDRSGGIDRRAVPESTPRWSVSPTVSRDPAPLPQCRPLGGAVLDGERRVAPSWTRLPSPDCRPTCRLDGSRRINWSRVTSPASRIWTARASASQHHRDQSRCAVPSRRPRPGAQGPRAARPAPRHPGLLKDNIDTADRMTTTAGSLALEGSVPQSDSAVAARLRSCRRRPARQGQHERVGQYPVHPLVQRMERPRGAVSQSLCARSEPLWVQLGIGSGRVGQSRRGSRGHRDRWIDRLPGIRQRRSRTQAYGWPGEPGGDHPDLSHAGHRRPASAAPSPMRRRCSACMAGPDPRDRGDRAASAGHVEKDYTKFLDPAGLRGARIGVARAKFFGYNDATDRARRGAPWTCFGTRAPS